MPTMTAKTKTRTARSTTPKSPLRDLQVLVKHLWDCPRHPAGCDAAELKAGADGDDLFEARARLDAALSSPSTVKEREADEEV